MKKNSTAGKSRSYIQQARDKQDAEHSARVLRAMSELLHNPQTPGGLFEKVAEFVTDQSNECGDNLWYSDTVLSEILKTVPTEDLRGATLQRQREEASNAAN
jgi:hypothetical protein